MGKTKEKRKDGKKNGKMEEKNMEVKVYGKNVGEEKPRNGKGNKEWKKI